jgi:8-oxo-dGTP diphosphatase
MDKEQVTIVVAVIQNEKGEILIVQRNEPETPLVHNKWEFVGGKIEFGETPEEAVIREAKEETGVKIEIIKLLPKAFSHCWNLRNKNLHILILSYLCKIVSGTPQIGIDPKIKNLKFIGSNDIENYECLPNVKNIVNILKF